jgi:hypothetical protein
MKPLILIKTAIAGIPILLMLLVLGLFHKGASVEPAHWQVMAEGAPPALIQQVQQDNLKGNTDVKAMKFWRIAQPGQSKLL